MLAVLFRNLVGGSFTSRRPKSSPSNSNQIKRRMNETIYTSKPCYLAVGFSLVHAKSSHKLYVFSNRKYRNPSVESIPIMLTMAIKAELNHANMSMLYFILWKLMPIGYSGETNAYWTTAQSNHYSFISNLGPVNFRCCKHYSETIQSDTSRNTIM